MKVDLEGFVKALEIFVYIDLNDSSEIFDLSFLGWHMWPASVTRYHATNTNLLKGKKILNGKND